MLQISHKGLSIMPLRVDSWSPRRSTARSRSLSLRLSALNICSGRCGAARINGRDSYALRSYKRPRAGPDWLERGMRYLPALHTAAWGGNTSGNYIATFARRP
jgi:hypothetical protein